MLYIRIRNLIQVISKQVAAKEERRLHLKGAELAFRSNIAFNLKYVVIVVSIVVVFPLSSSSSRNATYCTMHIGLETFQKMATLRQVILILSTE